MSFYGTSVEYGLHCIVWLIGPRDKPVSSRELADIQGVPPAQVAKIFPKLEKAGLVVSSGGISGGYRLARSPEEITILDVVDAIEGDRRLFDCREVRRGCALFGGDPPGWMTRGVCGIHAAMLRAEKSMRAELARTTLLDLAKGLPAPAGFSEEVGRWLDERAAARERSRMTAVKNSTRHRSPKD
jgi:Rrf2 family protein